MQLTRTFAVLVCRHTIFRDIIFLGKKERRSGIFLRKEGRFGRKTWGKSRGPSAFCPCLKQTLKSTINRRFKLDVWVWGGHQFLEFLEDAAYPLCRSLASRSRRLTSWASFLSRSVGALSKTMDRRRNMTSSAMVPRSPPSAPLTGLLVGYIHSHFYVWSWSVMSDESQPRETSAPASGGPWVTPPPTGSCRRPPVFPSRGRPCHARVLVIGSFISGPLSFFVNGYRPCLYRDNYCRLLFHPW